MAIIFLIKFALVVTLVHSSYLDWDVRNPAFDPAVYENALDPELCQEHLRHIRNSTMLRLQFLESGMRFPRGFLMGNLIDMGNYRQCLKISEDLDNSKLEGKYCAIRVPFNSNFNELAKELNWADYDEDLGNEVLDKLRSLEVVRRQTELAAMDPNAIDDGTVLNDMFFAQSLNLAVCIPKACTIDEGLSGILFNTSRIGFKYDKSYCRFTNDKPWAPVDYLAPVIFALVGILSILSTGHELYETILLKKDPQTANKVYRSFSVYTNTRKILTFSKNPKNLQCLDGIRVLASLWVVVGHTYSTTPDFYNVFETLEWFVSFKSVWITAAPYTVDTFFMLGGLLLVYTTIGKPSRMNFIKNIHLFYLYRILRMFPLLAAIVLFQASTFHHIADGPKWSRVEVNTNNCRTYWWSTLLYIQNYVNANKQCLNHAWYLAIDIQLYILSPLILFWVLSGKKKPAWIALIGGLLTVLTANTIYCFINKFPGWNVAGSRGEVGVLEYMYYYYFHALPRSPPFVVGMIFGYLLHLFRGKRVKISNILALLLWICSLGSMMLLMYITYLMKDFQNWDNGTVDDLVNSFGKAIWATALGWIIFACQHGYSGPINWFLSLDVWKLPSRISYAIYLFHYQMQFVMSGTALQPIYFSDAYVLYEFVRQIALSFVVAFLVTLLIDSPFSTLTGILLAKVSSPRDAKPLPAVKGQNDGKVND